MNAKFDKLVRNGRMSRIIYILFLCSGIVSRGKEVYHFLSQDRARKSRLNETQPTFSIAFKSENDV